MRAASPAATPCGVTPGAAPARPRARRCSHAGAAATGAGGRSARAARTHACARIRRWPDALLGSAVEARVRGGHDGRAVRLMQAAGGLPAALTLVPGAPVGKAVGGGGGSGGGGGGPAGAVQGAVSLRCKGRSACGARAARPRHPGSAGSGSAACRVPRPAAPGGPWVPAATCPARPTAPAHKCRRAAAPPGACAAACPRCRGARSGSTRGETEEGSIIRSDTWRGSEQPRSNKASTAPHTGARLRCVPRLQHQHLPSRRPAACRPLTSSKAQAAACRRAPPQSPGKTSPRWLCRPNSSACTTCGRIVALVGTRWRGGAAVPGARAKVPEFVPLGCTCCP